MKEQLKEAGLTENETKLYLALLELGPANAGLLSRKAGLHRRVVYDTADMLIRKGLIGYILRNNVRLFQASDPKRIKEMISEKEKLVDEIMPKMNELFFRTKTKEETNFYKGKNGLKNVFEDQLNERKEVMVIGASELAYDVLQFYFKWYDKKRVENKIKARIIFHKTDKKPKIPYSEVRYLPGKYFSPVAVNIWADKIALILWNKDNPLAIVIKNKLFAEGYKQYFELMWNSARKE